jgi:hypothetical protein
LKKLLANQLFWKVFIAVGAVALVALWPLTFSLCWNFVLHDKLGLPFLGYWESVALIFVCQSLMKITLLGKLKVGEDAVRLAAAKLKLAQLGLERELSGRTVGAAGRPMGRPL